MTLTAIIEYNLDYLVVLSMSMQQRLLIKIASAMKIPKDDSFQNFCEYQHLKIRNVRINPVNQLVSKNPSMNTKNANPADEIMCECSGTTREKIQNLFEQGMDIDAISSWTGAISGCGGCEWDIAQFLNDLTAQQNANS